ncbi:hypothetical protein E2562_032211 [Oryza meyeriana var. granulata]|uniref:Uncharacterized protein n=1 Tax=Oryza meyeriana var. granulata TaxID=110450 RepID=A0A6G1DA49_9ORYZ|nr:hypothetical protein E2562_032211 [Oryza meyeriana var. granulata]
MLVDGEGEDAGAGRLENTRWATSPTDSDLRQDDDLPQISIKTISARSIILHGRRCSFVDTWKAISLLFSFVGKWVDLLASAASLVSRLPLAGEVLTTAAS